MTTSSWWLCGGTDYNIDVATAQSVQKRSLVHT